MSTRSEGRSCRTACQPSRPEIAHRDSTVRAEGWFPGSGVTRGLARIGAAPSQTFKVQWPDGSTLHYRCGGSAGLTPASQFSRQGRAPSAGLILEASAETGKTECVSDLSLCAVPMGSLGARRPPLPARPGRLEGPPCEYTSTRGKGIHACRCFPQQPDPSFHKPVVGARRACRHEINISS